MDQDELLTCFPWIELVRYKSDLLHVRLLPWMRQLLTTSSATVLCGISPEQKTSDYENVEIHFLNVGERGDNPICEKCLQTLRELYALADN